MASAVADCAIMEVHESSGSITSPHHTELCGFLDHVHVLDCTSASEVEGAHAQPLLRGCTAREYHQCATATGLPMHAKHAHTAEEHKLLKSARC